MSPIEMSFTARSSAGCVELSALSSQLSVRNQQPLEFSIQNPAVTAHLLQKSLDGWSVKASWRGLPRSG
jgi:hypothetical protein